MTILPDRGDESKKEGGRELGGLPPFHIRAHRTARTYLQAHPELADPIRRWAGAYAALANTVASDSAEREVRGTAIWRSVAWRGAWPRSLQRRRPPRRKPGLGAEWSSYLVEVFGPTWYRRLHDRDPDAPSPATLIEEHVRRTCPRLRHTPYEDALAWQAPDP